MTRLPSDDDDTASRARYAAALARLQALLGDRLGTRSWRPRMRARNISAGVPAADADASLGQTDDQPVSTPAGPQVFGPSAPGLDGEAPIVNPSDDVTVAGSPAAKPYLSSADPIIDAKVAAFNKMNQADPGDDIYLDPDWIRAMVRVESGYDPKAYQDDPMQVNNVGDWPLNDDYKEQIGLTKGVAPGQDLGIQAGIDWLESKAYRYNGKGTPTRFLGWPKATAQYNGGGNPHYLQDVQKAYQDIKSGR